MRAEPSRWVNCVFAALALCAFSATAAPKRSQKKHANTVTELTDPRLPPTKREQESKTPVAPLPPALAGKSSSGQNQISKSENAQTGPADSASDLDLKSLRRLIEAHEYRQALATVRLRLALQSQIRSGDRLRLFLIKALIEASMGESAEARGTLAYARRYFESTIPADYSADRLSPGRVSLLNALEMTEFDVKALEGSW